MEILWGGQRKIPNENILVFGSFFPVSKKKCIRKAD